MIFKDKIINLPSGDNLSVYPLAEDKLILYIKNTLVKSKLITLSQIVRCQLVKGEYACDAVIRLSDSHICLCQGTSMSIISDSCENLL